jgi:hypothetical protein
MMLPWASTPAYWLRVFRTTGMAQPARSRVSAISALAEPLDRASWMYWFSSLDITASLLHTGMVANAEPQPKQPYDSLRK